jgi:ribonuclease Z
MLYTISGYSTALFSTWYFIDELSLLFDCGDGCTAALLQKSRKVKHVFISHADRDHLTGLLQFSQLNNRIDYPKVFYPFNSRSFPALQNFSSSFDPHIEKGVWQGIQHGEETRIGKDLVVTAIRNSHVPAVVDEHRSLGYLVERTKRKLKEEYLGLTGSAIADLRKSKPEDEVTYEVREKLLAYSGDTPVENLSYWNNVDILIHEATFLKAADLISENPRDNKHSSLEDVMAMASQLNINHLILGHFSSRYNDSEIMMAIKDLAARYSLQCAIYAVLPGQFYKDVSVSKVYPG